MKLIDTKEGKLLGVNFIDLAVLLVVTFIAFSFANQILGKDLVFGGEEMYNAIQTYQKLSSKGFLVEAEITGKWIVDESDFHSNGLILAARGGSLTVKLRDGKTVGVGGSMGYLEDIAASDIIFQPLDNYVLSLYIEPMEFSSYTELLDYLNIKKQELKADHLLLTTDISFTRPVESTKMIHNQFEELYLVKSTPIIQGGNTEAIFRVNLAELTELQKLKIGSEKVTIGKTTVVAGYRKKPSGLPLQEEYHIASVEELL
ncbi:MAG: TrmB family transcriptional regulator sugar-binding domain-containing protein [Candidatus Hydrothermarchaeales archaeon]